MTLPPEVIASLRRRGATSRKTKQPGDPAAPSLTLGLQRNLGRFEQMLSHSDPRATRGLAPQIYDAIVEAITEPRSLKVTEIHRLGLYLASLPGFQERARSLGLPIETLADEINAYSFAEKVHLVDAAELVHHGRAGKPKPADRTAPSPAPKAPAPPRRRHGPQ
jgi:hypothetical protein